MKPYLGLIQELLYSTPIPVCLGKHDAVVLERIARGGGATRWYYCNSNASLNGIAANLRPGSVVSFYFDQRIADDFLSTDVKDRAEGILNETGEVIIGMLSDDMIHLNMEIVTGIDELSEYFNGIAPASRLFYGVFPARDNDGISAITVTLPDSDGIVRGHPH
jgi:hypothetical protein